MKTGYKSAIKLFIIPLLFTTQAANAHGGLASLAIIYVLFFLFMAVVFGVSALICLIAGLIAKKRNQEGEKQTHVVRLLVSAICGGISIGFIYLAYLYV